MFKMYFFSILQAVTEKRTKEKKEKEEVMIHRKNNMTTYLILLWKCTWTRELLSTVFIHLHIKVFLLIEMDGHGNLCWGRNMLWATEVCSHSWGLGTPHPKAQVGMESSTVFRALLWSQRHCHPRLLYYRDH